ncbi:MAG: contact-dependent growth inhibition system immunity protein [Vicinamibacterales bacterium]
MSAAKKRASAPEFPALTQFLSGYLHQDFVLDHKTPEGARDAFLTDANARERAAVADEFERFLASTQTLSWADVRTGFSALGAAWTPKSRAALSDFARGFQAGPRRRTR